MADSDEEYDRKSRDKFRGERNEYRGERGGRRPPPNDDHRSNRGRDDWGDRDWNRGGRGPRIDYRLGGGHRVAHEFSPPNKRPRNDWDRYSQDSYSSGYGSHYEPPPPHHGGYGPPSGPPPMKESSDGHPQLLSFKAWLSTQDDSISDHDALVKYAEYKQEFKRQQLNEFFVAHREEEWFKLKYHPEDSVKQKGEWLVNVKKRQELFNEFLEEGKFDDISLDVANADKLAKLMDWYVVRLEGGTNEDAARLLTEEHLLKPRKDSRSEEVIKQEEETSVVEEKTSDENGKLSKKESGSLSSSESGADEEGSDKESDKKKKKSERKSSVEGEESNGANDAENQEGEEEGEKKSKKRKRSGDSGRTSGSESDEGSDNEEGNKPKSKKKITPVTAPEKEEEEEVPQLHRTASVFLRNLPPTVTKEEVEGLGKKYPGFLRVAIADPQPERRWYRRGWITFKRNVNIKEICWNLNSTRIRDTELSPIINKDIVRRVRTVNGITPHKTIVRNDIRVAAKVIQHLDAKAKLWQDDTTQLRKESYGVYSNNPVLKNITDYLIEEASAEEDELLGLTSGDVDMEGSENAEKANTVERDDELIKVLDRMLFYLRFVHSLDYYNHTEYVNEDDMPNRLSIMHGRGTPPVSKVNLNEIQDYIKNFEQKISEFFTPVIPLTEEECKVLGLKEQEAEVEKFITANTQELGKDKWLCPLSGKKFKGPDFVRKHIQNKHGEKIEEVKQEVEFFNNYLKDPKRPHPPDQTQRQDRGQSHHMPRREPMMQDRGDYPPAPYPPYGGGGYGMNYGGGGGGYMMPPRPYPQPYPQPYRGDFGPRGGRYPPYRSGGRDHGGNRAMVSYRDLDAPAEPDDF